MKANFTARKLTIRDPVVHVVEGTAWAEFYWDFAATMTQDRTALNTQGRETQIFHRTDRGWRLVHVHYSGMPVTGQRQGF